MVTDNRIKGLFGGRLNADVNLYKLDRIRFCRNTWSRPLLRAFVGILLKAAALRHGIWKSCRNTWLRPLLLHGRESARVPRSSLTTAAKTSTDPVRGVGKIGVVEADNARGAFNC